MRDVCAWHTIPSRRGANIDRVQALVRVDDQPIGCAIDKIGVEGATVRIHQTGARTMAVGSTVQLELLDVETGGILTLTSQVSFRDEVPAGRTYGLRFSVPEQVRKLATPEFAKILSRRQAFRVHLDVGQVVATLRLPREAAMDLIEAPLLDISTTGCAVGVTLEQEVLLADFTQLDIVFKLPRSAMHCVLYGDIRHREVVDEQVRYGIEYQPRDDGDYSRSLEDVIDFVMAQSCSSIGDVGPKNGQ